MFLEVSNEQGSRTSLGLVFCQTRVLPHFCGATTNIPQDVDWKNVDKSRCNHEIYNQSSVHEVIHWNESDHYYCNRDDRSHRSHGFEKL